MYGGVTGKRRPPTYVDLMRSGPLDNWPRVDRRHLIAHLHLSLMAVLGEWYLWNEVFAQ